MSRIVPSSPVERTARIGTTLRARVALLLTTLLAVLVMPSTSQAEVVLYPPADSWYTAPADIATLAPGTVIRSRSVTLRTAPTVKMPFTAYQVLYRTTNRAGQPIATAASIILPNNKRFAADPKLVSYQTAYDGLSPNCQPSYTLRRGSVALQGAETLLMTTILNRGWTIVTADYEGPDNNWGVAETTAKGVLDGIRAAESFQPAGLVKGKDTPVGMVGYSGGGNATGWANEWATSYAPELNLVGAAYGGVGTRLQRVVSALNGQLFAGIAFAGIFGVTSGYPEVDMKQYLNKQGLQVMKELRSPHYSCITDFVFKYAFQKFRDLVKGDARDLLTRPQFLQIAADNTLGRFPTKAPIYWYQTYFDQMNGYWHAREVANKYCAEGQQVYFETSYKEEHAMQAFSRPQRAYDWLSQRFGERPMKTNCDVIK
ncbi:MAG: hypothetical protein J7513_14315 [Solirubrobacteraceae bacterium]|nr:hypothetical protein [Solirubrobacteraceae bacterium]